MCLQLLHGTKHCSWISLASVVSSQQPDTHAQWRLCVSRQGGVAPQCSWIALHMICLPCACMHACSRFSWSTCPLEARVILNEWRLSSRSTDWKTSEFVLIFCLSGLEMAVCQILDSGLRRKTCDWLPLKSLYTWDKTVCPCCLPDMPRRWIVDVTGDVLPCLIASYLWRTLTGA